MKFFSIVLLPDCPARLRLGVGDRIRRGGTLPHYEVVDHPPGQTFQECVLIWSVARGQENFVRVV